MLKKVLLFSFTLIMFLGYGTFAFADFKNFSIYSYNLEKSVADGEQFIFQMQNIFYNPEMNSESEIIKYEASSKTYTLKEDVDFSKQSNSTSYDLYSYNSIFQLVPGSTFNGNNHKITNRYSADDFTKHFSYFARDKQTISSELNFGLIKNTNGANVYNLTFDNSPFAFGTISKGSQIKNVNMTNVDITNISVNLSKDSIIDFSVKNQYIIPIYATVLSGGETGQMSTTISNFYISNVNFSFNDFDLENEKQSTYHYAINNNVGVSVGMFGTLYTGYGQYSTIVQNAEIYNISVNDNLINTDFINENDGPSSAFSFSPLLVTSGLNASGANYNEYNYLYEDDKWNNSLLYANGDERNYVNDGFQEQITFKNIYVHDISFLNNKVSVNNATQNEPVMYFNIQPVFSQQNITAEIFDSIVIDDINTNSNTDITYFKSSDSQTQFYYSNNVVWKNSNNTSEVISQFTNSSFWEQQDNWSKDSAKKQEYFSSDFWNTNEGEELSILNSSKFNQIISFSYNDNTDLIMNLKINLNNYQIVPSNSLSVQIVDDSNNVLFNEPITSSIQTFSINIDALNLDSKTNYYLKINPYDDANLNSSILLNEVLTQKWVFNNFSNIYDENGNSLLVDFDFSDPLSEVQSIKVNLYKKNNLIDSKEIPTTTKSNTPYNIVFSNLNEPLNDKYYLSLELKTTGDYFYPDINLINYGGTNFLTIKNPSTDLMPNINSNWWIILLGTILAILLIMILVLFIFAKFKKNPKSPKLEYEYNYANYDYDENQSIQYNQNYDGDINYFDDYYSNDLDNYYVGQYEDDSISSSDDAYFNEEYYIDKHRYNNNSYETYDNNDLENDSEIIVYSQENNLDKNNSRKKNINIKEFDYKKSSRWRTNNDKVSIAKKHVLIDDSSKEENYKPPIEEDSTKIISQDLIEETNFLEVDLINIENEQAQVSDDDFEKDDDFDFLFEYLD